MTASDESPRDPDRQVLDDGADLGFGLRRLFARLLASIREINRKYAKPEIEITWFVKFCLLSLRIYLLLLVALMVVKFIMVAKG